MTVEELFALAPQYVDPEGARGVDRVVDIVLDETDRHQLVVRDGAATITRDGPERPQLTVRMSTEDVLAIADGRAHPVKLFFAGRIRTEGDLWGSRALKDVFVNPHAAGGGAAG